MLFESLRRHTDPPTDLVGIIRQARRRWRMKLAVRGAAIVAVLGLLLFLAAAYLLEWARFTPASILTLRLVSAVALAGATFYFLARPLMRRVTDEQVAMYLEEHEPSLQATLVSAVDASRNGEGAASAALVERLVQQAVERCVTADAARRVEREPLRRSMAALAAVALVTLLVFLLGPAFIRHAASALLLVSRSVEAAAPYRIEVTPGDTTIPRGADQPIAARLVGFAADEASLMVRQPSGGTFQSLPLVRAEDGRHEGMLFDLSEQTEYFVESGGVRSQVFTLKVVDLPYVQRLELEFHYPSYTGLPPQTVEEGGDIAVLRGTEVRLRVFPTKKPTGGRVVLHDKETVALAAGDEALTGAFKADRDGFYRIELDAPTGERVAASPQYTIDVLTDQAPTVSFTRPGRDTMASPIEEVFVEASAEDDYGVRNLELVYSVNGGPEKRVTLFAGRNRLPEVTAGHTFYLEELGVQPGDSVAYFARASDNDSVEGAKRATSDLYFLRVRPFKKDFRPAMSMAGGGGGGAAQPVDALSEQQRQIIAATFNLQRDRKTYSREKLREHTTVVALSQARLREQVEGLVARMNSRLVEPDPAFKKIAELLPQAVTEMQQAEAKLGAASPDGALPPEHRALQFLQKAEEEYETQVSTSNSGGGGGGGSTMAQELADLFELELDRLANQYETADRALQQTNDQQLDELLEKLKELARRQEQEAERQRRRAAAGQAGGSGSAQQRALADEAEEAARRLERLAREQNRADLQDSARRMREAADAMRRAAASGDAGAAAQANAALQRLRDIERRLQDTRSARADRDIKDAIRQADELAREQQDIAEGVRNMSGGGEVRREQGRQLGERKDALESKLAELEKHLDRSASDAGREEREASRKLSEAAGTIRDDRLRDKIRYSKWMVTRGSSPEQAEAMENDIAAGFDALKRKLDEAQSALGQSSPDPREQALEKARRLARGMESLQERMRERAEAARRGQQGGEPRGQQGSEPGGQPGEQAGQQGEQAGQRGEQGRRRGEQGAQPGSQGGQEGAQQGGQGAEAGSRADGSETQGGAEGRGDTRGEWTAGGGWGDRRPGDYFGRDEIRQFRNEIRRWRGEGQELRRLLQESNLSAKELDEILRVMRALDDDRVYQDLAELQRLQQFVTEGAKRFEFALRRRAAADGNEAVLSGADEVPEEFRKLVEQYYRSLAKSPR
jgi:hypothetical protein